MISVYAIMATLTALIIVLPIIWIIALARWDGKCHCDRNECGNCPYSRNCEYENEDEIAPIKVRAGAQTPHVYNRYN